MFVVAENVQGFENHSKWTQFLHVPPLKWPNFLTTWWIWVKQRPTGSLWWVLACPAQFEGLWLQKMSRGWKNPEN
jgi:hypothetical protein